MLTMRRLLMVGLAIVAGVVQTSLFAQSVQASIAMTVERKVDADATATVVTPVVTTTVTKPPSSAIQLESLPDTVITSLHHSQVPVTSLGVFVQEVLPGTLPPPLFVWQPELALQPASVMKLVTSYAALDLLGPAYRWKTQVLSTGHLEEDVLHGDLIIKGGGDPKLVLENIWLLLRQTRAAGIRRIEGNVVLDRSWMEPQAAHSATFDSAEFDGYPNRPYNVGADGLLVNYNALTLQLHDDPSGLRVSTDSLVPMQIILNVRRVSGACGEWRDKLTPHFSLLGHQLRLDLEGTYGKTCGNQNWVLQPYSLKPGDYAAVLFRQLWQEVGGELSGEFITDVSADLRIPTDAVSMIPTLVTEWRSPPLAEIIRDMNKYSNNVMARQIFLTLDNSVNAIDQQGHSAVAATRRVQDWLSGLGISTQGLVLDNGSGLSRSERISARQLGELLSRAFASTVMPELMASLPILGVDGTMSKRLTLQPMVGHGHIKSGTLDDVKAIAGYVLAASGKRYVVVCLVNDPNAARSGEAQDALLSWVYQHG